VSDELALTWKRQDASTIVALGAAGVGYVITADHAPEDEEARYTLRLPTGAYTSPSLVRLMLDAEEIERHAERRAAA